MKTLFALLLFVHLAPAWAINKCVRADGGVVYTDGKCPTGSKQAGSVAPVEPPSAADQSRAAASRAQLTQDLQVAEVAAQRRREAEAKQEEENQRREAASQERERQALLKRQTEALEALAKQPPTVILTQPARRGSPPSRPSPPQSTPQAKPAPKAEMRRLNNGDKKLDQ